MNEERTRKAFDFLRSQDGQVVSVQELAEETGWTIATVRTYISKNWGPWLRKLAPDLYRVQGFASLPYALFVARQSQVKASPSAQPDLLMRIERALREGESQGTEFKEALPKNRTHFAHEIAAFATSNEGLILVGVSDSGGVKGLGLDQAGEAALKAEVENIADKVRLRLGVSSTLVSWGPDRLLAVEVPLGRQPVYYVESRPYVRAGSRSRPAEPDEVLQLISDFARTESADVREALRRIERGLFGGAAV